ncbi:MAG: LIC12162 family protein [Legionella sp.]|nr:LIC12162 family protein [Legionella sp.]
MKDIKGNVKFLALTSLSSFWDLSKQLIYLGEWCCPLWNKKEWENLRGEQLKDPKLKSANSKEANAYTIEVFEKTLPLLAGWLNKINEVQYSERYWRILVGPFLLFYIQAIYYRYVHIKTALLVHPQIDTIGLTEESYKTPLDSSEFFSWQADSALWNLQLFTQIISFTFFEPKRENYLSWEEEIGKRTTLRYHSKGSILSRIRCYSTSKIVGFFSKKSVGLPFAMFSRSKLLKLALFSKWKVLPVIEKSGRQIHINTTKLDYSKRETITSILDGDAFSNLVLHTLKINLPMIFVENYHNVHDEAMRRYPERFSSILCDKISFSTPFRKFWCAYSVEEGAKIIHLQHGGGYGCLDYHPYEYLEKKGNYFISWGWKYEEDKNVIPFSSLLIELQNEAWNWGARSRNNHLILWMSSGYATSYRPYLAPIPLSYPDYIALQLRFYKELEDVLYKKIEMRLVPSSRLKTYYQTIFSEIKIDLPVNGVSLYEQLYKAQICVVDICQTVFLSCLAFNIPTILFWDPEVTTIRSGAMPFFEGLEKVKIYHSTPESAAKMLSEISDNPYEWWDREDVQKARADFCNQFVRTTPNWLKEFAYMLKNKVA